MRFKEKRSKKEKVLEYGKLGREFPTFQHLKQQQGLLV
jgi:hypothetical protein